MSMLLTMLQVPGGAAPIQLPIAPIITACQVTDISPPLAPASGGGFLVATCGDRSVPLGSAASYRTIRSVVTGGVLVVRVRRGKTEVLLASPTSGGVAIDDVTRDLARLVGRLGDLGLGSFAIDTTRFATGGSVGVAASDGVRWLDLSAYSLRAKKLLTALPPTGTINGAATLGGANTGAPR